MIVIKPQRDLNIDLLCPTQLEYNSNEQAKKGGFPINLLYISEKSHNFVTSNSSLGPLDLRFTQGSAPTLVRLKCV